MSDEMNCLIEDSSNGLKFVRDGSKVHCALTGHDMPARLEVVKEYLNSKSFKRAKEWYSQDFSKYEPYIVVHKKKKNSLYCTLTRKKLNKIPEEVEKHWNCQKVQKLLTAAKEEEKKWEGAGEAAVDDGEFDPSTIDAMLASDDEEMDEDELINPLPFQDCDEDEEEDEEEEKEKKVPETPKKETKAEKPLKKSAKAEAKKEAVEAPKKRKADAPAAAQPLKKKGKKAGKKGKKAA